MINQIPQSLSGVRVTIAEPINCEVKVNRTWKERLFTLPFMPFTKNKIVNQLKDVMQDGQIIKMDTGLYMNAKTFYDCEKAIKDKNSTAEFNTLRI